MCIEYNLAGFTNSINGIWTFLEVQEGDYISFLYGAKAYNLYIVNGKEAVKNAESIPPWECNNRPKENSNGIKVG